jgi:hypothetical protein
MRKKVTDEQLWQALNHSNGIYTVTRDYLKIRYGISISSFAIRKRAIAKPELLDEIKLITINEVENGLYQVMRSQNESNKLKAIIFYLKTQGKAHGYTERNELEVDGNLDIKVQFIKIPQEKIKKTQIVT